MPSSARSCDGSRVMSCPRNLIAPARGVSSPAIARKRRRLAGAVRADQRDDLALVDLERNAAAHRQLAIGELEVLGGEQRAHISSPPR